MPDTEIFDPPYRAHDLHPDELLRVSRATCPVSRPRQGLPATGSVDLYPDYVEKIPAAVLYAFIGVPQEMWQTAQDNADDDAQQQQQLSDTEVVVQAFQLIVAATHTTRSLIASCLYRLLAERGLWERVLADRSLLAQAVEESLRLDSPATSMIRTALEDRPRGLRPGRSHVHRRQAGADGGHHGRQGPDGPLPADDRGGAHQPLQGVGALSRRLDGVRVDLAP